VEVKAYKSLLPRVDGASFDWPLVEKQLSQRNEKYVMRMLMKEHVLGTYVLCVCI
jgi:hypothetical protein